MTPPISFAGFDLTAFWLSLRVASGATLLSALMGLPAAYLLARKKVRFRALWESAALLPLILPPTVLGYYLLVAFGKQSVPGRVFHALTGSDFVFTAWGATVAACLVSAPLLLRTAQAAFAEVDPELREMARTQGASEAQIFRYLILPLARRGITAGIGLAFARSLGDFGATLMVAGDIPGLTRTMPLAIYNAVAEDDHRAAAFYAVLLSVVCFLFSLLASRLAEPKSR